MGMIEPQPTQQARMATSRKPAIRKFWGEHDRETYTCPDCGRTPDEVRGFHVHHIDGDPSNNGMENLVGLCVTCHKVRHGSERWRLDLETWKEEFLKLGGDG